MKIEQLNQQLKNFCMKGKIFNRPGFRVTRLGGEYEIWIESYKTKENFESGYWISDMKYGWGLILDSAIQSAITRLKVDSVHIVED